MELTKQKRILCIDFGDKRIGIAISDEFGLTAQPHKVIERKNASFDFSIILDIIDSFQIGEIIVGMPFNMNGSIGPQAQKVLTFIDKLKDKVQIPINQWDERLSSCAAEKTLIEANVKRRKRKKIIDKMAAQYILQGYLDYKYIPLEANIDGDN